GAGRRHRQGRVPAPHRVHQGMSKGKALLGTLLYLLTGSAAVVGINGLMMPYRTGGGMFLGWLLCLAALAIAGGAQAKLKLGNSSVFFLPFLLFALYSMLYGVLGGLLPRLVTLRETPPISVAEADQPAHETCDVFHFSDGK